MTSLRERIEKLPQLPVEAFEVAGKLDYSDKVPVITIRPRNFAPPMKPTPKILKEKKCCWSKLSYFMWATYPRVFCQPPIIDPLPDQVNTKAFFEQKDVGRSNEPESDLEIISKKERFYKLTTLKGTKLQPPWWCSVKYGPWTALVTKEESCIDIPTLWTVTIAGIPGFILSWYGEWSDIPPYPNLRLFPDDMWKYWKEEHGCCPGFYYCDATESCIPLEFECKGTVPI